MRKALNLSGNLYLNMDNIVSWEIGNDSITITNNADAQSNLFYITTKPNSSSDIVTTREEVHRIKRELEDYMGVF